MSTEPKTESPEPIPGMAELVAAMVRAGADGDREAVGKLAEIGKDPSKLASVMAGTAKSDAEAGKQRLAKAVEGLIRAKRRRAEAESFHRGMLMLLEFVRWRRATRAAVSESDAPPAPRGSRQLHFPQCGQTAR